jgi:CRP-like cAMP-binding protein
MIFNEGDKARYVGLVLKGAVQVVRDDFYGKRSILTTLKEHQLFGESYACSELEYLPVGVYANQNCKIMLMDVRRMIRTCTNNCLFHTRLINNLLKHVVEKTLMLNQKIEYMSKKTTKEKVMAYLLGKAKEAGKESFTIDLDRQSLADYLGVERSAMSAEISKLKKEGYINVNKNHFEILMDMDL